jgi:hypothetical protein
MKVKGDLNGINPGSLEWYTLESSSIGINRLLTGGYGRWGSLILVLLGLL